MRPETISNMKIRSLALLLCAEVAGMALWFVSAAILPSMAREGAIAIEAQAALSSAVQAGFVVGAIVFAVLGVADRFDPRHVFAISAILAGIANLGLLIAPLGGWEAIILRALTGALLAGVYPVGMKIAIGWGTDDRGLLVGLLVGALTLGSAAPHLIALFGGADWRPTVAIASAAAMSAGIAVLFVGLGPHHARATAFRPAAILTAWTDRRIRLAYIGYLGHMWELFSMWAWIAAATAASYAATLAQPAAERLGTLTAFLAIGVGSAFSVWAGFWADRIGKAEVAIIAMVISGLAAIATALSFGGPVAVTLVLVLIWGAAVIPDSAQFSALVADAAPPDQAGSLMTFQTALGFALTAVTVQITPVVAAAIGWPLTLAGMSIGPALGVIAMLRLRALLS